MPDPASVLAFVLVGLKSAKLAHKVLTSFKDAPDNVKSATADVEGLLLILEGLSKCRALGEHGGDALRAPIDACLLDIEFFAKDLQSLTPEAPSSRRQKYKKRSMAMWEEKALTQMSAKIANHAANLNLCLNVLQSDVVVGIPSRLESISRELTAQQTARETHHAVFREQTATLGAVEEGITRLGGGFETMGEAMRTMASASTTSHAMLEEILQHVVRLTLSSQASSDPVRAQAANLATGSPYPVKSEPCKELMSTITRLCSRVNDNRLRGRMKSGEAKNIISDLLLALELMKSDEFLQAGVVSSLVDQDICSTCRRRHTGDLQTSLTTAYEALLNPASYREPCRGLQRTPEQYHQGHSVLSGYTYETSIGTLSVLSRQVLRTTQRPSHFGQSDLENLEPVEEEEVATSVSLVSKLQVGSQARHAINVSVRQIRNHSGVFSAIPHLMVYNVLPADSPVFALVQEGRLREFQTLLGEGKASLRDQDEYGAPLLFYASQPEMCRYLIESGADVNHIASNKGVSNRDMISSALCLNFDNLGTEGENRESTLSCYKYLAQAGCDPTLPIIFESEPLGDVFGVFLFSARPEAIQILFDFRSGFVNANTKVMSTGLSPLSELCRGEFWSAESIAVLLKRNADVTERDTKGRICLHFCLSSPWRHGGSAFGPSNWLRRYSAGIILLIKHGADVYAEDRDGLTVSDVAYTRQDQSYVDPSLESVKGDVWDFALAGCGYDISTFRQGRCRRARHGKLYQRQDFEKLWEGQEHLCPYYYDEEVCPSDEGPKACLDEDSEEGWMTTDSEDEESGVVDMEEDAG